MSWNCHLDFSIETQCAFISKDIVNNILLSSHLEIHLVSTRFCLWALSFALLSSLAMVHYLATVKRFTHQKLLIRMLWFFPVNIIIMKSNALHSQISTLLDIEYIWIPSWQSQLVAVFSTAYNYQFIGEQQGLAALQSRRRHCYLNTSQAGRVEEQYNCSALCLFEVHSSSLREPRVYAINICRYFVLWFVHCLNTVMSLVSVFIYYCMFLPFCE